MPAERRHAAPSRAGAKIEKFYKVEAPADADKPADAPASAEPKK